MSWSFSAIGKPSAICAALDAQSAKETGQCKVEFDSAMPHLKGLVLQNYSALDSDYPEPVLHIDASGSGWSYQGVERNRQCNVSLKHLQTKLV